ncbi:hypothetical protein [Cohnella sp. WQ 127256]|uniref:hypothetical protein n=1 Tax=Cohnella sp. WQ 127256 TaxID=2938790 RepID=UPI00211805E8|nr:hypothetical protein [Cohnella sp. WQ 127256]
MNKRLQFTAVAILLFLLLSLTGCSGAGSKVSAANNLGEALSIQFSSDPVKPSASGSTTLNLDIKEQSKPAIGAAVVFEIWPKGQEQHAQLNAKSVEDGLYFIKGEFSQVGDYYLLAHVTSAEGVHEMKTFEFTIQ